MVTGTGEAQYAGTGGGAFGVAGLGVVVRRAECCAVVEPTPDEAARWSMSGRCTWWNESWGRPRGPSTVREWRHAPISANRRFLQRLTVLGYALALIEVRRCSSKGASPWLINPNS